MLEEEAMAVRTLGSVVVLATTENTHILPKPIAGRSWGGSHANLDPAHCCRSDSAHCCRSDSALWGRGDGRRGG